MSCCVQSVHVNTTCVRIGQQILYHFLWINFTCIVQKCVTFYISHISRSSLSLSTHTYSCTCIHIHKHTQMHTHFSLSLYTHHTLLASEYSIVWIYHDIFKLFCSDGDLDHLNISLLCTMLYSNISPCNP